MGLRDGMRRQLYEYLVSSLGLQRWSAFEIAEANYPTGAHEGFLPPVVSTREAKRLTNQCIDGKITLDALWEGIWGVSRREFTERYTASKGVPLAALAATDPIWAELERTYLRERPMRTSEAPPGSLFCGGGFSVMPSGFPFPVPDRVRLTPTDSGIQVSAGSVEALWEWSDLLEVKIVVTMGSPFVVGTLVTSEGFQLMARRGAEQFVDSVRRGLSSWESQLPNVQRRRRETVASLVLRVQEAEQARRAAAGELRRLVQPDCSGWVVASTDGRKLGKGPVFLDTEAVVFHNMSGSQIVATVPYSSISGLEEHQVYDDVEFFGECSLPSITKVAFAPRSRAWLETYTRYVDFNEAHDVSPALADLRAAIQQYKEATQ